MNVVLGRVSLLLASAIFWCLSVSALGQQGGNQGPIGQQADGSVQNVERGISAYLGGNPTVSILSPGEYVDYALNLKAGQVVIGDARSDAFDPALEIVDDKGKVLAMNDDRYPGDQRPLIFWRCDTDGVYKARVRCYHDKSGGQVFVRFTVSESIDMSSGMPVEKSLPNAAPFFLRIPMKAGQIREVRFEAGDRRFASVTYNATVGPGGLPDIGLSRRLNPAILAIIAPVDADYYVMYTPNFGRGSGSTVKVSTPILEPAKLVREGGGAIARGGTNGPLLAELPIKKGELLQVATPDLSRETTLLLAERPDFSKYDLSKPETNPFLPHPGRPVDVDAQAFDQLPARARDGRVINFRARRDTTLWVATNGIGPAGKEFALQIKPAAREFSEGAPNVAKLRVADYDQWAFDGKPGDVMTFNSTALGFNAVVVVRDPDLNEIRNETMELDQTTDGWRMVVQKPGRYLLQVSCLGDGGSGEYSLSRKSFKAQTFSRANPAKGEISAGEIQIWKFTATPNDPVLIHWLSSAWNYEVAIYDEKGNPSDFQQERIDGHNQFGILKVTEPSAFVIVLTGTGAKSNYSIELGNIPGYKKGG